MDDNSIQEQAVELLQQLGLKEYEARSFVALARRESGTARDISETSEVPRTRVYDAIRVLEAEGLVEVQHSNPQRFRAVSIDEAVDILRTEYEDRVDTLRRTLHDLDPIEEEDTADGTNEVWMVSGAQAITSRAQQLIDGATEEVVLVVGHEGDLTEPLTGRLREARTRGVDVIVGTITEEDRGTVQKRLPDAEAVVSGVEWLRPTTLADDGTELSRLVLVDREALLVGSITRASRDGRHGEQAVFCQGADNGLVAIVRRVLAAELRATEEPITDAH